MIDPYESTNFKFLQNKKDKKNRRPLEELIFDMAMQADDRDAAIKAFDEVIERYSNYLEYTCRNALVKRRGYDETDLQSLVSNTFFILFQKADQLLHIETLPTEKQKETLVMAWLTKVAHHEGQRMNETRKAYNEPIDIIDDFTKFADKPDDANEEETTVTSMESILFTEVLNECTEREQKIILTYYDYLDGRKHLPAEESRKLCDEFGILPDNLNHIKNRTFKKINKKCRERMEKIDPGYWQRETD